MDTAVQTEPVAWIVPDFGFLFPTEEAAQRYLRNINDLRKPIALYAASQPTPDVTKLVEALEAVMEFGCDPKSNRGRWALEKAESALAAYRKGVQI